MTNSLTSTVNHILEEKGKNKQLWEKNEDGYVYIPYEISNAASEDQNQVIVKAIKEFTDKTFIMLNFSKQLNHLYLMFKYLQV